MQFGEYEELSEDKGGKMLLSKQTINGTFMISLVLAILKNNLLKTVKQTNYTSCRQYTFSPNLLMKNYD